MDERWLTVEEIADHLRVSNDTIYNWIKERGMPAHKVGRKWMFLKTDVDNWVKSPPTATNLEGKVR